MKHPPKGEASYNRHLKQSSSNHILIKLLKIVKKLIHSPACRLFLINLLPKIQAAQYQEKHKGNPCYYCKKSPCGKTAHHIPKSVHQTHLTSLLRNVLYLNSITSSKNDCNPLVHLYLHTALAHPKGVLNRHL